jgi:phosphoglycerate-specific signal transduction histidine kinase
MRLRLADLVAGSDLRSEKSAELQRRNEQLVESYSRIFALREQLASAEKLAAIGQTAANVAHQVGTPLNLISTIELPADTGRDRPSSR